ncbi:septum site-determining protein MinC [Litoribrevibacter euphylliae]|uniref:Probable septum site-determining protein MinC n=1 Tax=Litoribrevibacter euphylliae TaxID=1834034 RepID=A0ABV7HAK2_9GAMM
MSNNAFALKSQMIPLTVIELASSDDQVFDQQLTEKVNASPALFDRMPAILGLEDVDSLDVSSIQKFLFIIRKHNILPVALKGPEEFKSIAQQLDLAWIPPGRNKLKQRAQKAKETIENTADNTNRAQETIESSSNDAEPASNPTPQQLELTESEVSAETSHSSEESHSTEAQQAAQATPTKTKIVSTPVRSGQQIYAKDSDLIVLAQVGQGAEVIADGNIHIYGTLRGRAIAGANGNKDARIFCQSLHAELISIAGVYQVSDDLPNDRIGQSSQIELKENHLHIDTL